MTVLLLGTLSLTDFQNPWFFSFLLVVLGLAGLCVCMQLARHRRMLRFANMELLDCVAPTRPTRWRHLPAVLLVSSLALFTIAMAGAARDVRTPRNRAVVMLVIDVSQSMRADDVAPSRLVAAREAATQFAGELTPGINLGLIAYAGTATLLVSPTTNRDATKVALDTSQVADRTAIGGGDAPPPARIVLCPTARRRPRRTQTTRKGLTPRHALPRTRGCRSRPCRSAPSPGTSTSTASAYPCQSTTRC